MASLISSFTQHYFSGTEITTKGCFKQENKKRAFPDIPNFPNIPYMQALYVEI